MDNYKKYALEWNKLNKDGLSLREIAKLYNVSHNSVSRILKGRQITILECHTGKFKDITNEKFGLITAVEVLKEKSPSEDCLWNCFCACNPNKIFPLNGSDLRRLRIKHCGCNFPRKIDISGKKYGRLTAIKDSGIRRSNLVMCECLCECLKTTLISYGDLTTGHTTSCGCQRPKGENHYEPFKALEGRIT